MNDSDIAKQKPKSKMVNAWKNWDKSAKKQPDSRKKSIKDLSKLITKKPDGYQITSKDLDKCKIDHSKMEAVREAINSTTWLTANPAIRFFGALLKPVLNFFDALVKIAIAIAAFLCFMQFSALNVQADKELQDTVKEHQRKLAEYNLIKSEIGDRLRELGINTGVDSKRLNEELENSEHWVAYHDKKIGDLWQASLKDWSVTNDIKEIYKRAYNRQSGSQYLLPFGILGNKLTIMNAFIFALGSLLLYIILQSGFCSWLKTSSKRALIESSLKKVV